MLGGADGGPGLVDVFLVGPGQAGDFRQGQFLGHGRDGFQVAFGGRRESGFDDVNAKFFQPGGDPQLFIDVHAGAR